MGVWSFSEGLGVIRGVDGWSFGEGLGVGERKPVESETRIGRDAFGRE